MSDELIILEQDKQWARQRISELEQEIQALGPEFYDVFNQSSETWHDNAPFEALRDRQSLLDAELQQLRRILRQSSLKTPPRRRSTVGIGSRVTVENKKGVHQSYMIAGDWTPRAGMAEAGAVVVSAQAPLAKALWGRRVGVDTPFGRIQQIE